VVDGLVDIEEEYLRLLLLDYPSFSEVDHTPAIDEHEHPDVLIDFGLVNTQWDLGIGGDRVDLVLYIFALEEFLDREGITENILRVQMLSMSTAAKMTMET